jgi:hypothetical protein
MAWISESFSGTSADWMTQIGSETFSTEQEAREYAGSQIIKDYADTVKVYEEWSENIPTHGPKNSLDFRV